MMIDTRQTTRDITSQLGHQFKDYSFSQQLMRGLQQNDWKQPTPIQQYAIPSVIKGDSIIAKAKNGTGKTGAFLLPILHTIKYDIPKIQALILVPNKQLTLQICSIAKALAKYTKLGCQYITGGQGYQADKKRLRGKPVHLVIATPGRIMDLSNKKIADLSQCNILVLDEADRLLDLTFIQSVERVILNLPKKIQILLFSATFPLQIKSFTDKYLSNSKLINLMRQHTLVGVTQYYIYLDDKDKLKCLNSLLSNLRIDQCIIFANSTKRASFINDKMISKDHDCLLITGGMDKISRNQVYEKFTKGKCKYLISTDVWSRGIDIRSINVVINFDFPTTSQTYLHRIGRSGRYGHRGLAVNLIVDRDKNVLLQVQKELDTQIKEMPKDPPDPQLYCS